MPSLLSVRTAVAGLLVMGLSMANTFSAVHIVQNMQEKQNSATESKSDPLNELSRRPSIMIRKLKSGEYRLYSRKINPKTGKRRNLGTFSTRSAAEKHEKAVQFFKRQG